MRLRSLVIIFLMTTQYTLAEENSMWGPKVFLEPAPLFDMDCQQRTGFVVDPSWFEERTARIGEFRAVWQSYENTLNKLSQAAAGRNFPQQEYVAALILCKWTPMGLPLIVSLRPFLLKSAEADPSIGTPLSKDAFVSMLHHEVLHSLVSNIETQEFSSSSKMLGKYSDEKFNVLVHLHLMAIQYDVYTKMKNTKLFEQTGVLYDYIGGDYKRAWEIVKTEGPKSFLEELQKYNQMKKSSEKHAP